MIIANVCTTDARIQRLCASKVHVVAWRFDQKPWIDASKYKKLLTFMPCVVTNQLSLQTHNGIGSCNEDGNMENPCPDKEIKQMIHDGCSGTDHGDGLKQV